MEGSERKGTYRLHCQKWRGPDYTDPSNWNYSSVVCCVHGALASSRAPDLKITKVMSRGVCCLHTVYLLLQSLIGLIFSTSLSYSELFHIITIVNLL